MTEAPQAQAPAPESAEAQASPEARGFSQEDVNKIAGNRAKEARQAAINDLLEKTGAESIDDVLSAYTEYQGIQEAVTTEADRANQRAEKLEARAKSAEELYTNTLREYALRDALRDSGINPERLKGAMRLADMSALEVDSEGSVSGIEEVVEAVRNDSPEWFEQKSQRVNAPQTTGTTVSRPNGQTPEEIQANWLLQMIGGQQ
jgi:hypothetical protein